MPVDIAVNQILALTAAAHAARAPAAPTVPVYHIAAPQAPIPMRLLNDPRTKLARPYIPAANLLAAYRPMVTKLVAFDTARARHILGLPPAPPTKTAHGCPESPADVPVDTTGFLVDVAAAAAQCGGWMRYLQLIRDAMEDMEEPETFEAHVD